MDGLKLAVVTLLAPLALTGCSGVSPQASVEEVASYLEQRYERNFEPIGEGQPGVEGDPSVSYRFRDPRNPEIVFEAGVRGEQGIFPFLPPTSDPAFYDTYREALKEWAVRQFTADMNLEVTSEGDIPPTARRIYEAMGQINDALEAKGFEVTGYTPSFEADVTTPSGVRPITFYQMDESVISTQLREAL